MKKHTWMKGLALAAVLGMGLTLSACYVAPDEITDDLSVTSQALPWQTVDTSTAVPTATSAPQQIITITQAPEVTATSNTIVVATATPAEPAVATIQTITLAPSSATKAPTATPKATDVVLKNGSSGSSVRSVQKRLKELGYYTGTVDGDYGSSTEKAVRAFQQKNGLTVDGKVGPTTLAKLNSSSAIKASATAAPKATATVTTLKQGSTGSSVRSVQQRLKKLGYYTGTVDGNYGEATVKAVRAFQSKNGLTVDGKVGAATLARLNSSSAISASATATPKATAKATATPKANVVAQYGDRSDDVTTIQTRLKALGYMTAGATGYYGDVTRDAVKSFQKNNSLTVTGVVDKTTFALLKSSKAKAKNGGTAQPTATPIAQRGDKNDTVMAAQERLKELGYFTGTATGYFGTVTQSAIRAFQKANGLTVTGTLNKETQSKLNSKNAVAKATATPKPTATPTATPAKNVVATRGDRNDTVKAIQARLKELGYMSANATGYYGDTTYNAVKSFQKVNGLTQTGTMDKTTYSLLNSTKAKKKSGATAGTTPQPTEKPTATPNPSVVAQYGDRSDTVSTIQTRLKELGYMSINATGYFGGTTEKAVKAFQKANSLSETGVVDKTTYNLMNSTKAKKKDGTTAGTTPAPTTKPTATPNPNTIAQRTDKNSTVTAIQERLKQLGYMSANATGYFGETTEKAVTSFQQVNGLSDTGVVDKTTYNLLMSTKAKKKDGTVSGSTPAPTSEPTPDPNIVAQRGDTSSEVTTIQNRLRALGYFTVNSTGTFGAATESAVKAFQKNNNLAETGIVTKTVYNLMMSTKAKTKSGATAGPDPTEKATASPRTDIYLYLGSKGSNVTSLQNRLIELGYMAGKADGSYGGATEYAVHAYQSRNGLYADGKAGSDTLNSIYSSKAKSAASVASSIGTTLKSGSQGTAVTALQKRLRSLGYLSAAANGTYGDKTVEAVKNFQSQNGLKASGEANTATLNAIYLSTAAKAKTTAVPTNTPKVTATPEPTDKPVSPSSAVITSTGYTTLMSGDSGDDVTKLQNALKKQGYMTAGATGKYASKTEAAVKKLQQENGLRVTGIAGPATQRILYGKDGSGITYSTLKENDTGNAVRVLQYTLYEWGYYSGQINGIYGQSTIDAVEAFQLNNGISPANGQATNKTQKKLYSNTAIGAGN